MEVSRLVLASHVCGQHTTEYGEENTGEGIFGGIKSKETWVWSLNRLSPVRPSLLIGLAEPIPPWGLCQL